MNDIVVPETVWPCWAYVLKRIKKSQLLTADWINNKMPKLLTKFTAPEDLCCGDIVVWASKHPEKLYSPVSMLGSNVIWIPVEYKYHAASYEYTNNGEHIVSDMISDDRDGIIPFIIRFRSLNDVPQPDFVLRKTKLKNNKDSTND